MEEEGEWGRGGAGVVAETEECRTAVEMGPLMVGEWGGGWRLGLLGRFLLVVGSGGEGGGAAMNGGE